MSPTTQVNSSRFARVNNSSSIFQRVRLSSPRPNKFVELTWEQQIHSALLLHRSSGAGTGPPFLCVVCSIAIVIVCCADADGASALTQSRIDRPEHRISNLGLYSPKLLPFISRQNRFVQTFQRLRADRAFRTYAGRPIRCYRKGAE